MYQHRYLTRSQSARAIARKDTFRFLDLPLELRYQVYTNLLVADGNCVAPLYHHRCIPPMPYLVDHGMALQTLQVCKQMHKEGRKVMLEANLFVKLSSNVCAFQRELNEIHRVPILVISSGPSGSVTKFTGAVLHTTFGITKERTEYSEPFSSTKYTDVLLLHQHLPKALEVLSSLHFAANYRHDELLINTQIACPFDLERHRGFERRLLAPYRERPRGWKEFTMEGGHDEVASQEACVLIRRPRFEPPEEHLLELSNWADEALKHGDSGRLDMAYEAYSRILET